jgi:hypothetical protein
MFTWGSLALNVKRMPLCTFASSEKLQSGQHGHGGRVYPKSTSLRYSSIYLGVCLCVSRLRNSYFSVTQKNATVV